MFLLWAHLPILIIVGPHGGGKGYCAEFFKKTFHYNTISAGDLLRHEVNAQTPLGKEIAPLIAQGQPVNPDIMKALLEKEIDAKVALKKPFIIDGFGGQHPDDMAFLKKALEKRQLLSKAHALFLEVSDEVCASRMRGRLICPQCDRIYNKSTCPPRAENECDDCRITLVQRPQDREEQIQNRLRRYRQVMEQNYAHAKRFFPFTRVSTEPGENVTFFYKRLHESLAENIED